MILNIEFIANNLYGTTHHIFHTMPSSFIFRKPAYTFIVVVAITVHLSVTYCIAIATLVMHSFCTCDE